MKPVVCQSTDLKQTLWVQWIKVLCIHFTYSFSKQKALSKSNDNQWSIIHFVCLTFKCFLVSWKWISKLLQQWGVWLESITFAAKTLTMLELYSFFSTFPLVCVVANPSERIPPPVKSNDWMSVWLFCRLEPVSSTTQLHYASVLWGRTFCVNFQEKDFH